MIDAYEGFVSLFCLIHNKVMKKMSLVDDKVTILQYVLTKWGHKGQ